MAKRKIDDWIQYGELIPERREVLETWARNGLTMEEIARNMQKFYYTTVILIWILIDILKVYSFKKEKSRKSNK